MRLSAKSFRGGKRCICCVVPVRHIRRPFDYKCRISRPNLLESYSYSLSYPLFHMSECTRLCERFGNGVCECEFLYLLFRAHNACVVALREHLNHNLRYLC